MILHSATAESSRVSVRALSRLACGRARRVANASAGALEDLASMDHAPVSATDLLPLLESWIPGVVNQALAALTALAVQRDTIDAASLVQTCRQVTVTETLSAKGEQPHREPGNRRCQAAQSQ